MYYVDACKECAWHLQLWRKDGDGEIMNIPYKCRSWRHEGECRLWRGAQDFIRIKQGMDKEQNWSHITLTYRQRHRNLNSDIFRNCLHDWARLRKRIIRTFGRIQYIQTWEVHRSGWPHVHVALSNRELYSTTAFSPYEAFDKTIANHAGDCGFGPVGWLEPLRDKLAFSGYLCKLARELTGSGKQYQVPINAPRHFRRLRASVRLLPPPHKDPDITGILRYCSIENAV